MSEQAIQSQTISVGAVGTINRPIFHVPSGFGGMTLLNVWLTSDTAATIVSMLANMGTALGTALVGAAIGTLTDGTMTASVRKPYTISTAYQAENTWLGLNGVTGTIGSYSTITIEYKWGK